MNKSKLPPIFQIVPSEFRLPLIAAFKNFFSENNIELNKEILIDRLATIFQIAGELGMNHSEAGDKPYELAAKIAIVKPGLTDNPVVFKDILTQHIIVYLEERDKQKTALIDLKASLRQ